MIYTMGLNIKNPEVERLATEVARMAGESKTESIRKALSDRKLRLEAEGKGDRIDEAMRWLRQEVWPSLSADVRGRPVTKREWDELNDEEDV